MKSSPIVRFDESDRLKDDECAQETRDRENSAMNEYTTTNLRNSTGRDGSLSSNSNSCNGNRRVDEFADKHRNLRPWQGYGVDKCRIDIDSKLKNDRIWTNDPSKTQWITRTFVGVPNLGRGKPMPVTESRLINGQYTSSTRSCDPISEKQLNVFHPTVMPVCTQNIIPDWTWGGASSRDIARSPEFMESQGYKYDGRMWIRNC